MMRITALATLLLLCLGGCEDKPNKASEVTAIKESVTAAANKEVTADNADAVADQLAKEIEADATE